MIYRCGTSTIGNARRVCACFPSTRLFGDTFLLRSHRHNGSCYSGSALAIGIFSVRRHILGRVAEPSYYRSNDIAVGQVCWACQRRCVISVSFSINRHRASSNFAASTVWVRHLSMRASDTTQSARKGNGRTGAPEQHTLRKRHSASRRRSRLLRGRLEAVNVLSDGLPEYPTGTAFP
jgi:hypothetical protein